jgi:hypothetical protein
MKKKELFYTLLSKARRLLIILYINPPSSNCSSLQLIENINLLRFDFKQKLLNKENLKSL